MKAGTASVWLQQAKARCRPISSKIGAEHIGSMCGSNRPYRRSNVWQRAKHHRTSPLDGFANLISGEVIVHHDDNAATLDWRFDAPAWTRAWRLLTTATIGGDAVTRIELKPMPPK